MSYIGFLTASQRDAYERGDLTRQQVIVTAAENLSAAKRAKKLAKELADDRR